MPLYFCLDPFDHDEKSTIELPMVADGCQNSFQNAAYLCRLRGKAKHTGKHQPRASSALLGMHHYPSKRPVVAYRLRQGIIVGIGAAPEADGPGNHLSSLHAVGGIVESLLEYGI